MRTTSPVFPAASNDRPTGPASSRDSAPDGCLPARRAATTPRG
jgi:hypothetical protein